MIRTRKKIAHLFVPFIFIMLIMGCKDTSDTFQSSSAVNTQPPAAAEADNLKLEPDPVPVTAPPAAGEEHAAVVNPNDKVSLASVEHESGEQDDPPAAVSKPAPSVKPKIDIQDTYNQSKPTLLGLTLKTSADAVTEKYGMPKSQFVMEDEDDPIVVYDYGDFQVGFNQKNLLHFIDVRSSQVNPGLNGLKLGGSTNDVFDALGKPDSNTSFVLTYKSTGAVLKLDIDPKSDKVNSIKLFALD